MWHSTQISKWNNAFKVCDRKPVFREQWGFTGCSSYGPLGEISHRRWWRKMGRCSLGEVTSKGSKGEERHEGLGVRLCEGSKVLPSLEATKLATTLLWVLPEDRRPLDQRQRSLLLLHTEQCECPSPTPPPPVLTGVTWKGQEWFCGGFAS